MRFLWPISVALGLVPGVVAQKSLLVYTRTVGYYHESIPAAIDVITGIASNNSFHPVFSTDPDAFNATYLSQFNAIAFVMNTGAILNTTSQRQALNDFLLNGGGLFGAHSNIDSLHDLPCYGTAFGAYFDRHPSLQTATFLPTNLTHPATANVPAEWTFQEEVYQYKSDPRATNVSVLITVDDASYSDSDASSNHYQGPDPHPIAWYRDGNLDLGNGTRTNGMNATAGDAVQNGTFIAPGRVFFTSLGHLASTWQDPAFQSHITGGLLWVLQSNTTASTSV